MAPTLLKILMEILFQVVFPIMLPILRILSQQGIKTLYFCDVIKELKCNKGLAI